MHIVKVFYVCSVVFICSVMFLEGTGCRAKYEPSERRRVERVQRDASVQETLPEHGASDISSLEEDSSDASISTEYDPSFPPLRDGMKVRVRSLIDGDTVYVYAGESRWPYYKIRMLGYNSPECKKGRNDYGYGCVADDERHGLAAYAHFVQLLKEPGLVLTVSCPVRGQTGQLCKIDPYKRSLAFLLLPDGRNVAKEMVASGYGWVFTSYYPPMLAELCRAEAQAIREKKGIWVKGRDAARGGMSGRTLSWYYHSTPSRSHDAICSKALGESFVQLAGEQ